MMMTTRFDENGTNMITANTVETEVTAYLANNSFTFNFNYPEWRQHTIYNTTLSSLAPVKRLSFVGQIETARRNKLSDECFERLLLPKVKVNTKAYLLMSADERWLLAGYQVWSVETRTVPSLSDLNLFFLGDFDLDLNRLTLTDFDLICELVVIYDLRFCFK